MATNRFSILSLGLALSFCAPGRHEFQKFEPESNVKLTEIFNQTPAILSAFRRLNPKEFNQKMTALVHRDPVASLKFLLTLADLTDSSNPSVPAPLPRIFDSLSYDIAQLANYYQNQDTEEFNTATSVGSRILDIEPTVITYGTSVLARILRYVGDISILFPDDYINSPVGNNTMPSLTLWKRCKDFNSDFAQAKPVSAYDGRYTLVDLYDILRIVYCFYEGRTPAQEEPGAFMRKALETVRDAGDVENRMADLAYDLQNEVAELRDAEASLADWLIKDPDKVAITDYLVTHGYTVLRKEFVFDEGKPLLDLQAAHLTLKNPAYADNTPGNSDYNNPDREYLFEWLLDSLYEDSPLLDKLDHDTITDLTVIHTNPLYDFGKQLVHNSTYGYQPALTLYTKPRLREVLWSGWSYDAATGTDPFFKGILYSDGSPSISLDGPVVQMAQRYSNQTFYNHFREQARAALSTILTVPNTYQGESMLSAILGNIYYYLKMRFYSPTHNRWALDADDAEAYFGDPERSLLKYIGSLQYSLRNAVILNPYGEPAGSAPGWAFPPGNTNTAYRNLPYLSALLYTIAASNGLVDQENAPAELTLGKSLASMGANIDSNGIRTIDLPNWINSLGVPDMQVRVACPSAPPCETRVWRNGEDYTIDLNMFDFELISPGRFISRTGYSGPGGFINNGWRGLFSPQQGDVETTNIKTSNWVMVEMALNLWEGYGPFTFKGKAPNGSSHKYQNDYYTDTYITKLHYRASWNSGWSDKFVAMGSNAGFEDASGIDKNGNIITGQGKYHIYERIYIPKNSGDPCYGDSRTDGVVTYPYARYGYIRPTNDPNYHVNSNCSSWQKIQIDFDTLEEAITANLEWLLKYKKYVFVIPMSGDTDHCVLGVCSGAAFVVVSTINANGIYGVTTAKRAGGSPTDNGRWRISNVSMGPYSNGLIPNSGNGFISEGLHGGAYTVRYGATSFEAADSMVALEINGRYWGLTMVIVDVFNEIWNTLGDGPVTPQTISDNFAPILAMAEAKYTPSDLMANPMDGPNTNLDKFKKFYDTYFPADDTSCTGGVLNSGSNGQPDLYENYANGCIKAKDLPPVPRVNPNPALCRPNNTASCIKYPKTYDTAGNVATWYAYTGASESRFSGLVIPMAIIVGTMHEDGDIVKDNGANLASGENRDNVVIRNFAKNGFREHIDTFLLTLTSLNEAKKQTGNNLPEYSSNSFINLLTETSPGLRNGFLPKLVTNKYANVAYLDPLINDAEKMTKTLLQDVMNKFELLKGNNAGTLKNIDKLRYFATKRVIDEGKFPTNKLGKDPQGRPNGTSDEPINQLKSFLAYLRKVTQDEDIKLALKEGVPVLNKYFDIKNFALSLDITDEDIDKVIGFLNAKSTITNKYIVDAMLDLVVDLKLNDPRTLYDFDFDNFKAPSGNWGDQLDEVNNTLAEYFGEKYDFKKKLLFSWALLGEPTCSGGYTVGYYDANGDGIYNRGIMRFVNQAYTPGKNITVTTNVGSQCNVTVPEPNIYEPHYYVLNFDNITWYLNDKLVNNTQSKLDEVIDFIFDLNYDSKIDEVKDDILKEIYDKKIAEPSVDRNKNGVIEAGEFTDINGNSVWDDEASAQAITIRNFITYYISKNTPTEKSKFRELYEDLRDGKYLKAALMAMDDLLNPINPINVTCTDDDPNNDSPNCLYISSDLVKAQKDFLRTANFTTSELRAVKRVVGRFFYDSSLDEYTYPISNVAQELAQIISAFRGQYVGLLEMGIAGFAPDGFLTYLSQMKTDPQYSGIDVLLDLRTLANTEAMRCYTGKNAPYCYNKSKKEMFWPQLSQLLRNFAEMAYKQHHFTFSPELNFKYYEKIQGTF